MMQGNKHYHLFQQSFLALPISAQCVAAWQVLTGLSRYEVFLYFPLVVDLAADDSAMDDLIHSAYRQDNYSSALTPKASHAIAGIICSPDYEPRALIEGALLEVMLIWERGDPDENALRWQALMRYALIFPGPLRCAALTDCLEHESTAALPNFCIGATGLLITPKSLELYSTVVQGLLIWMCLRGLYVSGVSLPKSLGAWRTIFFAFPVTVEMPPMLSYLLGQIAFCWGDTVRSRLWFESVKESAGQYNALSQLALSLLAGADDATLQTEVKLAKQAANQGNSNQMMGCNDATGIYLAIRQLHAGANAERLLSGLRHLTSVYWPGLTVTDAVEVLEQLVALQRGERDAVIEMQCIVPLQQAPLAQSLTQLLNAALYYEAADCPKRAPEKPSIATLRTPVWAEIRQMQHKDDKAALRAVSAHANWPAMLAYLPMKATWEYAIAPLERLIQGSQASQDKGDKRWAWHLEPVTLSLSVVEQTLGAKGQWSRGRVLSLQRLYDQEGARWPGATAQDIAALKTLQEHIELTYSCRHDEKVSFVFAPETLLTLVGHPYIYEANTPSQRIELTYTTPFLWIREEQVKQEMHYRVALSHPIKGQAVLLDALDVGHYEVVDCCGDWMTLANLLGASGIVFPVSAKPRVMALIRDAKPSIAIQTDLTDAPLPSVPGSTALCAQCVPEGDDVWVRCWVRPLGDKGPRVLPGEGNPIPVGLIMQDGVSIRTRAVRDFAAELEALQALYDVCPELAVAPRCVQGRDAILTLLMRLQEAQKTLSLTIEWPQGQRFRLRKTITDEALALHITGNTDWFSVKAEVSIDDDMVLDMRALLDSTRTSGQFIELGKNEFVALSEALTHQLQALDAVIDDEGKLLASGRPIAAALAKKSTRGEKSSAWQKQAKHWEETQTMAVKVPTDLKASLRDYQVQGFEYLARMSHWGMGACLADDMGLGKTVQAIALLLHLAKDGAALIIAPTSVCYNWTNELAQFAPTLKVINVYTEKPGNMPKMLPGMVCVCSYGLLTRHQEVMCQQPWHTMILDEAQAIKNPGTKSWRAVKAVKVAHRFALTGTPIENHLGELWSLFEFLNPGYLGTLKAFQKRFIPTASQAMPGAHEALKQVVAPFLLRRTKAAVLPMLPKKTCKTVYVTLSPDERAFYEALRQRAVERLSGETGTVPRMTLFNELTRLRQACCHPKLVNSRSTLTSSKLTAVRRLLKQLLENQHKVLIFSQFVQYLAHVKTLLEELGVSYHYLDGKTPVLARQREIDAFQAGEGEVFLISLKAGGSGLNLTAADDVIHLDPWWNPAVEDQAADRAHRIGQTKPVTVYRLVTQDTIEEQIVALHSQKRDLAEAVLCGQGGTGQLTTEVLQALLQRESVIASEEII